MPITQARHHAVVLAATRIHATLLHLCQQIDRVATAFAEERLSAPQFVTALREATFHARNQTFDELAYLEQERAHYALTQSKNTSERLRRQRRRDEMTPTAPTPQRRQPTAAEFAEALEDVAGIAPPEPERGQYDEHMSREKLNKPVGFARKTVEDLDDADIDLQWNEQLGRFVPRSVKEQ